MYVINLAGVVVRRGWSLTVLLWRKKRNYQYQ